MSQGGQVAVEADEDVVAASKVRDLKPRVRELERLLGRKTLEAVSVSRLPTVDGVGAQAKAPTASLQFQGRSSRWRPSARAPTGRSCRRAKLRG
jgi:hypothetical protein